MVSKNWVGEYNMKKIFEDEVTDEVFAEYIKRARLITAEEISTNVQSVKGMAAQGIRAEFWFDQAKGVMIRVDEVEGPISDKAILANPFAQKAIILLSAMAKKNGVDIAVFVQQHFAKDQHPLDIIVPAVGNPQFNFEQ